MASTDAIALRRVRCGKRGEGGDSVLTRFASTFVGILAGVLVEREELSVLKQLCNILTDCGRIGLRFAVSTEKREEVHCRT
jgi:hypothetical protein